MDRNGNLLAQELGKVAYQISIFLLKLIAVFFAISAIIFGAFALYVLCTPDLRALVDWPEPFWRY